MDKNVVRNGNFSYRKTFAQNVKKLIHESFIVPGTTICFGDWKLLFKDQKPGGGGNKGLKGRRAAKAGSLFNLREDNSETKDVSSEFPEILDSLQTRMNSYMESFNKNIRHREKVSVNE